MKIFSQINKTAFTLIEGAVGIFFAGLLCVSLYEVIININKVNIKSEKITSLLLKDRNEIIEKYFEKE